ncbi:MAG: GNAT family N-acetyltransferase [Pseudomonadota bacterium]
MGLSIRDLEIFKPYATEFPEELLLNEGADDSVLTLWLQAPILRVIKHGETVLGAYAMQQHDPATFYLHGVVIFPRHRRQGVGRWFTGHALGVAESKGGRRVLHAPGPWRTRLSGMFTQMGFVEHRPGGSVLRFDLIPE